MYLYKIELYYLYLQYIVKNLLAYKYLRIQLKNLQLELLISSFFNYNKSIIKLKKFMHNNLISKH